MFLCTKTGEVTLCASEDAAEEMWRAHGRDTEYKCTGVHASLEDTSDNRSVEVFIHTAKEMIRAGAFGSGKSKRA